jgi:hypothetical protein
MAPNTMPTRGWQQLVDDALQIRETSIWRRLEF